MTSSTPLLRAILLAGLALALSACGGGGSGANDDDPGPTTFTIGGTVAGLTRVGLSLRNNGGDALAISSNGNFTFPTRVAAGGSYAVTIASQPPDQVCELTAASGTANANVTNVLVSCANGVPHSIGGTASGLTGTLVLRNNGGNDLTVNASGAFTFGNLVGHEGAYSVTVLSAPPGQVCAVSNGFGVALANVTNVAVACSTPAPVPYTIGGTVSGLTTTGLVLKNNGGDALAIAGNGAFTFATPVNAGGTYAVTVSALPLGQFCAVAGGSGTATANVTGIQVNCVPLATRSIGGTVSGLTGTVVLQVNGGNNLSVTTNGAFTFSAQVNIGPFAVKVLTQPAGQVCTVTNGSDNGGGGRANTNVTNVGVLCATPPATAYTVGGSISGMTSSGLVLTLTRNGSLVEALGPLAANLTAFTFATPLANGDAWAVAVSWQPNSPQSQGCQITAGGSGTVAAANASSVQVGCSTITVPITGTIIMGSGSLAAGLVLRNNGGDDLTVPAGATSFSFPTVQTVPSNFRVTIKAQPDGQTCTVANGFGAAFRGTQPGGTAVEIRCLNLRTANPLGGVYTVAVGGEPALPGYYLVLFNDGTYLFTSREDDPAECPVNSGNGVEYGVYTFNATTKMLRFENAALDTNGNCGLMEASLPVRVVSGVVQNGSTKVITATMDVDGTARAFTFTPVASATGQLLGAWTGTRLGFVVYRSDATFLFASAETSRDASISGIEEACYAGVAPTGSSGGITFNFASGCMPHGSPAVDTTGTGTGLSGFGTVPLDAVVSGDTLSVGGGPGGALVQWRIVPN